MLTEPEVEKTGYYISEDGFMDGFFHFEVLAIIPKSGRGVPKREWKIVDNSEITITGSIGRALTVDGTNVKVKNNSALNLSNSLGDDILFKSEGKIEVDQSSQLNFKTIKLDESIKGTDLNNLIVSENYEYQLDEQGNLIITEKQHNTENNPGNETDMPQTGDDSNLYPMIGMAITSLIGLIYLRKTSPRKDII